MTQSITTSCTFCIPCFNSADHLAKVITSIQNQTIPPESIIVIDDGSTDNSISIARSLGVLTYATSNKKGPAAARNCGLVASRSNYIAFIDSDVVLEPTWFEEMLKELTSHNASGAGGRLDERYQDRIVDRWRAERMSLHQGSQLLKNVRFASANTVFLREALISIDGFDDSLTTFEDMDLCDRLLATGNTLLYVPTAQAWHLRRDTLDSIAARTFNWRLIPLIERGAFEDLTTLVRLTQPMVVDELRGIDDLIGKGLEDRLGITLYIIGYSLVRRFERLSQNKKNFEFLPLLSALLYLQALFLTEKIPHEFIKTLNREILSRTKINLDHQFNSYVEGILSGNISTTIVQIERTHPTILELVKEISSLYVLITAQIQHVVPSVWEKAYEGFCKALEE